jgi:DNA-binding response OmpR family regulator
MPLRYQPPERPTRVLVVDPDPAARRYLRRVLRWAGYEVATAAGARAATSGRRPAADVIVCGLSPLAGAEVVRGLGRLAPVVAVIDGSQPETGAAAARAAGAVGAVARPLKMGPVLRAVGRALRSSRRRLDAPTDEPDGPAP